MRAVWSAVLALLLLAGCAGRRDWASAYGTGNPLVGQIYDVAAGRPIDENELALRLGEQDFVLVGQVPGNLDHARKAAGIVAALASRGRHRLGAVALESLPVETQPQLVEFLAAHPGDAPGLDELLKRVAPDRPHLAQFSPALAVAVRARLQVVAADLSADSLRAVLTHGYKALQPDFVQRTGLAEPFATPVQEGLRQELATVSCEQVSGRGLDALIRARRARDASMADRLAAVTGRGQSLLLAVQSHVRGDRGVSWYLRQLRPGARIASLAFVELASSSARPPELPYDYVWYTPSAIPPDFDACAELHRGGERAPHTSVGTQALNP